MNAEQQSDVPASQYLIAVRQSEQVRERAERAEARVAELTEQLVTAHQVGEWCAAERDTALDLLRRWGVWFDAWFDGAAVLPQPPTVDTRAFLSTRTPRETP